MTDRLERLPTFDLDGMFATRNSGELITIEPTKTTVVRAGVEHDEMGELGLPTEPRQPSPPQQNTEQTPRPNSAPRQQTGNVGLIIGITLLTLFFIWKMKK
ncbi:MAG: hypothetical protein RMK43_12895 [Cyclobacteriaceae bacterium]|nr:hypothetical protein [Cyclobacteriaceae bacterium]